jgi:hypothetical protein
LNNLPKLGKIEFVNPTSGLKNSLFIVSYGEGMAFNRFKGSYYLYQGLMALLCAQAFCARQEGAFVYEIRFGVIEPPVVAQKDITVRAPMSNQQTEPLPLECSGLAWLDGYLLIASDRHEHLLFTSSVDLNTLEIGTPQPQVLIHNEQDLFSDVEAVTVLKKNGQSSVYVMSSLSNAPDAMPLPARRQFIACNVRQVSPFTMNGTVFDAGTIRQQLETYFEKINVRPYYTYNVNYPGENKNTYRWANVEGITFTPDGQFLLCGMRNPLFDKAALLFTVSGIPQAKQALEPQSLKVMDLFFLDLEGRGISDLSWDPVTQGYLITAAKSNGPRLDPDSPFPLNTLDSALFWWTGNKTDKPILVARIADMTIEAVCRLGSSRYIVLGSDEGDVSEGRTARQSILTVMDFTGIPR